MRTPEEIQRLHGERVEARQHERADTLSRPVKSLEDFYASINGPDPYAHVGRVGRSGRQPTRVELDKTFTDLAFTDLLLNIIAGGPRVAGDETGGEPPTQERIDPIDNNDPPFFRFWRKLNADLSDAGMAEAGYKTAKRAFEGGPTPTGALAFIGKEWDGLRAVPTGDGGYNGEFRQVSDDGTVWRSVHNHSGPRVFSSAEGALNSARQAKKHSEEH